MADTKKTLVAEVDTHVSNSVSRNQLSDFTVTAGPTKTLYLVEKELNAGESWILPQVKSLNIVQSLSKTLTVTLTKGSEHITFPFAAILIIGLDTTNSANTITLTNTAAVGADPAVIRYQGA